MLWCSLSCCQLIFVFWLRKIIKGDLHPTPSFSEFIRLEIYCLVCHDRLNHVLYIPRRGIPLHPLPTRHIQGNQSHQGLLNSRGSSHCCILHILNSSYQWGFTDRPTTPCEESAHRTDCSCDEVSLYRTHDKCSYA